MGYLCPVCQEPFADSQQCANHLAVTAILHGESHEAWLAETVDAADGQDDSAADDSPTDAVDSWESISRDKLAELVAEHADETTDHDHPGDHEQPANHAQPANGVVDRPTGGPAGQPAITESTEAVDGLDTDAQAILREARELTERMAQRHPNKNEDS